MKTSEFVALYPEAFDTESSYPFYLETRDGWDDLLKELILKIKELTKPGEFKVLQVKEKFGGLRFYYMQWGSGNPIVENLIEIAESESFEICDICGKPGELTGAYWGATRCPEHPKE